MDLEAVSRISHLSPLETDLVGEARLLRDQHLHLNRRCSEMESEIKLLKTRCQELSDERELYRRHLERFARWIKTRPLCA